MSDIIFVNQVVRVSPDNKGGMVGEDEHWVFLKRLLLSKGEGLVMMMMVMMMMTTCSPRRKARKGE